MEILSLMRCLVINHTSGKVAVLHSYDVSFPTTFYDFEDMDDDWADLATRTDGLEWEDRRPAAYFRGSCWYVGNINIRQYVGNIDGHRSIILLFTGLDNDKMSSRVGTMQQIYGPNG